MSYRSLYTYLALGSNLRKVTRSEVVSSSVAGGGNGFSLVRVTRSPAGGE